MAGHLGPLPFCMFGSCITKMSSISFSKLATLLLVLGLANTLYADKLSSWITSGYVVSSVTFPATDKSCSTTPTGATILPLGVCQVLQNIIELLF